AASSSKLDLLLENLETTLSEGHRALIFSQWTSLLDLIEPQLSNAGINYLRLDGSTADRSSVVEQFQSPDGPPVMLLSLKAGGVGLTLTAADYVFLMDSWWNPAVEEQAADRVHRIGQDKPVLICRLVTRDTVEEKILALQQRKKDLADAVIGNTGSASSSVISRDDLLFLLQ
ncbi:DEAD/DEAH box helicase, partial [bacterium]|nr:DEAD/DEAH box helicase [bacterium]